MGLIFGILISKRNHKYPAKMARIRLLHSKKLRKLSKEWIAFMRIAD